MLPAYGYIDPSDGIPFREPAPEADEPDRRWRHPSERCIYRRGRRYRVRVRYRGQLFRLGTWSTISEARAARDCFRRLVYGCGFVRLMALRTHGQRKRVAGSLPSLSEARRAAEACC